MFETLIIVPVLAASLVAPPPAPDPATPLTILPDRFEARAGENLSLRLESAAGAPVAWSSRPVTWFMVRVAGTQENRDAVPGAAGATTVGAPISLALEHAGVTMIGADFAPTTLHLTPKELRETLDRAVTPDERDKVLKDLPAEKPLRVRLVHSAKSLVRALPADPNAPAPPDAQTTGSKSGQLNEIRCLLDPLNSLVGGDITVRLHADTDKAARARAHATNLDTGKSQEFLSDSSGIALFHLDQPGRWRIDFSTARRLDADPSADIAIYTATLTFAATRTEVSK